MNTSAAVLTLVASALAAEEAPAISPAAADEHGVLVHEVQSAFQEGKTKIRVLLPDAVLSKRRYPAIYVLPVERADEARFGDGLREIKEHQLHNQHGAVFICPTFSHLPWYADHPTNTTIRQETYFLNVVVPFIERTYPVDANFESRLLLGFSKSGWGAWSLLLRHPDLFGRAAAWDAPFMMDSAGKYGSGDVFGTQENFANYRITDLLRAKGTSLGPTNRLILLGYGNFRRDHQQLHGLLNELSIPHIYRDGPQRKHDWDSGWVAEATRLLLEYRSP